MSIGMRPVIALRPLATVSRSMRLDLMRVLLTVNMSMMLMVVMTMMLMVVMGMVVVMYV